LDGSRCIKDNVESVQSFINEIEMERQRIEEEKKKEEERKQEEAKKELELKEKEKERKKKEEAGNDENDERYIIYHIYIIK